MIVAFVGDNTQIRDVSANEFINGFINIHGNIAVDKFRADELELPQLMDAITTAPFLTPKRLVVVRGFTSNKTLSESLQKIINSIADTTDLVFIEDRLDTRTKATAEFKKLVEVREFAQLDSDALFNWIISEAEKNGGNISYSSAVYLVERIGTNQLIIGSELAKLALYDKNITNKTIDLLTVYSPTSSIFAMLDALFSSNLQKAINLYNEQLQQGMEPRAIMGMIAWQLHSLALVVSAGNVSSTEIAEKSKLSPFVIRKNQITAKKINKNKLIGLYAKAIEADKLIKTNKAKPQEVVLALLTQFA